MRPSAAFRSPCPVARSLEVIGDKWTLLVVRDLMLRGKHTYTALQRSPERIPTNILADRLKRLAAWGLVERIPYESKPTRHAYRLTPAGESLRPVLESIAAWGRTQLGEQADPPTQDPGADDR